MCEEVNDVSVWVSYVVSSEWLSVWVYVASVKWVSVWVYVVNTQWVSVWGSEWLSESDECGV